MNIETSGDDRIGAAEGVAPVQNERERFGAVMASAKGHVLRLQPLVVPAALVSGARFFRFDDEDSKDPGAFVTLRVDPLGHLLFWAPADGPGPVSCLEFCQIIDVRCGRYARLSRDAERVRETFVTPATDVDSAHITIVSGANFVDLTFYTFVAESPAVAELWTDALNHIARNLVRINSSVMGLIRNAHARLRFGCAPMPKLKDAARLFATQRDERRAAEKAMQTAHFPISSDETIDTEKVDEAKFFNFIRILTQRKEICELFYKLGSGEVKSSKGSKSSEPTISIKQFISFLNEEQRDPRLNEILYPYYTEKSAQRLIDAHEPNPALAKKGALSLSGFLRYLFSNEAGVLSEETYDHRPEDMSEPLSSYFINSSHNTYLVGPQMRSQSSVEMYRQVLLAGCRSIELDCWDRNDEPVITHGPKILFQVSEIPFKDVISAIAESAFKTSDYPLVLSLENHCGVKNQRKMATYLKDILGDLLLKDPLPSHPLEPGLPLPSPAALMRKVIIKNKKNSETPNPSRDTSVRYRVGRPGAGGNSFVEQDQPSNDDPSDSHREEEAEGSSSRRPSSTFPAPVTRQRGSSSGSGAPDFISTVVLNGENSQLSTSRLQDDEPSSSTGQRTTDEEKLERASNEGGDGVDTDEDEEEEQKELTRIIGVGEDVEIKPNKDKTEVHSDLSELVNYTRAMGRFKSFELAEKRDMASELYSLSENKGTALLRVASPLLVQHNRRQITRLFPRPSRVESTNFIPQAFWNAGCQMVALNYQTLDLSMQLNLGVFERNGKCGYVLKPESMRRKDRNFNPMEMDTVENIVANTLSIEVISGQMLSTLSEKGSRVSTYVEVEMYGLCKDTVRSRKHVTRIVRNNGINPHYQDPSSKAFEFPKIIFPELAVLRIIVNDEGQRTLAQRILPVTGIRPGYRHIVLRNTANQVAGMASLFVRISVRDFVPDAHRGIVNALQDPIGAGKKNDSLADALVNPIQWDQKKKQEMLQELLAAEDDGPNGVPLLVTHRGPLEPGTTSPTRSVSSSNIPARVDSAPPSQKASNASNGPRPSATPVPPPPRKISSLIAPFAPHQPRLILDTYEVTLPTLELIDAHKKMEKLRRRAEDERRSLLARQKKVLHSVRRGPIREKAIEEWEKLQEKQRSGRRLGIFGRAKKLSGSQSSGSIGTERRESQLSLRSGGGGEEGQRAARELASCHWTQLKILEMEHLEKVRTKRNRVLDRSVKAAQESLEEAFNKDVDTVHGNSQQRQRVEMEDMQRSNPDKDFIAKARADSAKRHIDRVVSARHALDAAKTSKEEQFATLEAKLRGAFHSDFDRVRTFSHAATMAWQHLSDTDHKSRFQYINILN